uniref:NADH dehydrogenase subunit 6 n=1 Tax=Glycera tesselata TaxID=529286 RepID=A0A0S3CQX8_9ANNE|nr:NADH dehydrogenase subunit 6 [Glycera tesselata]
MLQMITYLFMMTTLSVGFTIILTLTPLSMGFWLLLLALLVACSTGVTMSSWFGLIIFLIYIGGMLVMFAYFTAIQPNQQFKIILPMTAAIITSIILPPYMNLSTINSMTTKDWWITTLFNPLNLPSLTFLALVLFLALISVVKISFLSRAPLRPFMYV